MRARTVTSFLVALIVVAFVAQGAIAQAPVSQFDAILAQAVVATNSVDVPVLRVSTSATVAGTTTTNSLVSTSSNLGAASVTTLSTTGAISANRLNTEISSQQTVAASSRISVTTGIAAITAAGPVTVGDIMTGTNGQQLIIVNAGSNAVTVPDSGLNRLSAGIALGQYDTLTVIWYANAWTQVSTSNN
jgi:hypothetical protein